jgi:group I intron endonuclease
MKFPGVYIITHVESGRSYIGSSKNIQTRIYGHLSDLRNNRHHSQYLQRVWNKYGEESFKISVLEECVLDKKIILSREQHFLDTFNPVFNGCQTAGSRLGYKISEETRQKQRLRVVSDETRAKIGAAQIGRKASEETRLRMSEAALGKAKDPESIRKAWEEKHRRRFEKRKAVTESLKCKTLVKNDVRPTLRRLTDDQVREIRTSLEAASTICKRFNCTASAINKIRRGSVYKDVF